MYIGVTGELAKLSSPSEVDSFISVLYQALHQERVKLLRYRPLARLIGLYRCAKIEQWYNSLVSVPSRGI